MGPDVPGSPGHEHSHTLDPSRSARALARGRSTTRRRARRCPRPHTDPMRTLGVEEEFLLVTPEGRPQPVATTVLRHASTAAPSPTDEPGGDLEKEFKQEQIETSTPPRADLAELVAEIRAGRARTDAVARQAGARIAALATAPQAVESTVLPDRRAYAIRAEFAQTARDQLTCGCHVHVSIADEDEGVRILDHLRPWNAVLLALSGNSPSWQGTHHRLRVVPLAGVGPLADGGSDRPVRRRGRLPRGHRRPPAHAERSSTRGWSTSTPGCRRGTRRSRCGSRTCAWTPTTPPCRPRSCAGSPRRPRASRCPQPRTELLRAATWRAARSGLTGDLVSPLTGTPLPAADVVAQLVEHVRPGPDASRRPGVGGTPGGHGAAARQRRDPAAGLAGRGRRRRRGGPPRGRPDAGRSRAGPPAARPGRPAGRGRSRHRERISACTSSTTSHTLTFIAASTRPSRRQNAMSSRPCRSPRTTTSSYPWDPTYPTYSMPRSNWSVKKYGSLS